MSLASIVCALSVAATTPPSIVSEGADHTQFTTQDCGRPSISKNARYVAFVSSGPLVAGDANGERDVYLKDTKTGAIELISRNLVGAAGNAESFEPLISDDGRYVAFKSYATNLIPFAMLGPNTLRVFVRDRTLGATFFGSADSEGHATGVFDVDGCYDLSRDGRFLAFVSGDDDVVPGHANLSTDAYVRDRETGDVELLSLGLGGADGDGHAFRVRVARGGRFVFFDSLATNLDAADGNGHLDVFVVDRKKGKRKWLSQTVGGDDTAVHSFLMSIAPDGSAAVVRGRLDTSIPGHDAFVVQRKHHKASPIGPDDALGDSMLFGTNSAVLSADGRYVAFDSDSVDLTSGPEANGRDVFLFDRKTGKTRILSKRPDGTNPDGESPFVAFAGEGLWLAFESAASGLAPGDADAKSDVFRLHVE